MLLLLQGCKKPAQTVGTNEVQTQDTVCKDTLKSPFIGRWEWVENGNDKFFDIDIGERNDTLLFSIDGIFYQGCKIQTAGFDGEDVIPQVMIPMPKVQNVARGRISSKYINFYTWDKNCKDGDVSFEIVNDTTLIWRLTNNNSYWPNSAVLIKKCDTLTYKFSTNTSLYELPKPQ